MNQAAEAHRLAAIRRQPGGILATPQAAAHRLEVPGSLEVDQRPLAELQALLRERSAQP